jgi:hypothetical protein
MSVTPVLWANAATCSRDGRVGAAVRERHVDGEAEYADHALQALGAWPAGTGSVPGARSTDHRRVPPRRQSFDRPRRPASWPDCMKLGELAAEVDSREQDGVCAPAVAFRVVDESV